jgi:hypothetical protein
MNRDGDDARPPFPPPHPRMRREARGQGPESFGPQARADRFENDRMPPRPRGGEMRRMRDGDGPPPPFSPPRRHMRDDDDDRGPRGDFRQGPSAPPMPRNSAFRERGGEHERDGERLRDGRRPPMPPMRPGFGPPPPQRAEREGMREMEDFLFGRERPRHGANVPPRPRADAGTLDDAAAPGLPGDERQADAS